MKQPTLRKLRNRGLVAIRYRTDDDVRHGWIVRNANGNAIQLVGEERPRRLSRDEWRHVTEIGGGQ